ncbi:MAG: InlB B-repeat-containing protein, partial [Clostridia bacterium]|nr:InlB B-repeat-containing protein [Clostridia bacterium]
RLAEEREAKLKREQEIKRKKAIKKGMIIGIPSAVAVIVLIVLTFTLFLPLMNLKKAKDLLDLNKYEESKVILEELGGFSNSDQYIAVIEGVELIAKEQIEKGVKRVLEGGTPVTLHYDVQGGDISGKHYLGINGDGASTLFGALKAPMAEPTPAPGSVKFDYASLELFEGLKQPTKEGYSFVKWVSEGHVYTVDGTFELMLKAVWNKNQYTIECDLAGGNLPEGFKNRDGYNITDASFTLIEPVKEGYKFIGWTGTDLTEPTKNLVIETGSAGNRKYLANWQAESYTVILDVNGGELTETSITATYGQYTVLAEPTRIGYAFMGWYLGDEKFESGEWAHADNVILTASWQANEYEVTYEDTILEKLGFNVTFDYNCSSLTDFTVTVEDGETLEYPTIPTRSGYAFIGWYTDSDCTTKYDFSGTITDDMTLYAGWMYTSLPYVYSEYQIDPADYASSSEYYSISTSGTSSSYQMHIYLVAQESGDHTIYWKNDYSSSSFAYYLRIYNLTTNTTIRDFYYYDTYSTSFDNYQYFTCNAGDVILLSFYRCYDSYWSHASFYFEGFEKLTSTAVASGYKLGDYLYEEDESETVTVTYDSAFTLPVPEKTGYTFLGWYEDINDNGVLDEGEKVEGLTTWNIARNITLTPIWEASTHIITLDADGGTVSTNSVNVTYGQSYNLPEPNKVGYTFAGWYRGGTEYSGGIWVGLSNIILTAKWNINTYNITYILNGGTNYGSNPLTYTVAKDITLGEPTKTGYTFTGWTGTGLDELTKNVIINDCVDDREYTAHWQANEYTVTLDVNGGTLPEDASTTIDVTYDVQYTLPTPTKTGYEFLGWFTSSDTEYESGTWQGLEDVSLTAKWQANEYEVTYEDTKGTYIPVSVTFNYNYSGSTNATLTLEDGQTLDYPTVPTRSGHAFAGWYTNSSCTTAYNFSGSITEDITLYAKWVSMTSSYSSREYIDIANHNTSSSKKTTGNITSSSSSIAHYYYFTCYKTGNYTFYANYYQGDFYITVYNVTKNSNIISSSNLYNGNKNTSESFSVSAGDVIYVRLYKYNSGSSTGVCQFYLE